LAHCLVFLRRSMAASFCLRKIRTETAARALRKQLRRGC